ncbi:hypothetical protein [Gimesia aquarii]|uniref:RING-type domain-containing protein n=1 Tax=Gimesia aquarii TaxID=2527964 RepID=A0A517X393_9PLAN|nr:hypothetical protein [Gimesia aquarii]QDU11976.1 hypothetical protein V202x_54010 [Gimesia aquarii]
MSSFKTQLAILFVILSSLSFSDSIRAEESYERFTVRTWTYRDGAEETGKLITVSGPIATLKLDGKGTVRVPLEKLSVKDLNWLYEYHKRKKQLSFLPPQYRRKQKVKEEPKLDNTKPAETEPKRAQPEKNMSSAKSRDEESYKVSTTREWTLQDGSKHQAKFLFVSKQNVMLSKKSGGSLKFSLDQLSEKDLSWIIEYHRRNNLLTLLPVEYQKRGTPGQPTTSLVPNLPKEMAEKLKEQKSKTEELAAEAKANMTTHGVQDDPNVIKANTEIDPALVAALSEYRVWSDKKGQKSEARFSRINGREIIFTTRTAGFLQVPIGTLIEEDLQLLRDALKMHGRFEEMPLVYREPLDPNLSPTKLKQLIRVNNHRKWTDLSGNSTGASYVKMEDGKVFLNITKTSMLQEFPYLNFSPEDQEYVQERLKKEIPGQFFPDGTDTVLTLEEREKEFRVWTDRNKRQIKGKFVRLAYGDSVAVINTGEKEELFITEFFSDQDLSLLKPPKQKQTDQLAMNNNTNVGGFPGRIPGGMNRGMTGRGRFRGAMPGSIPGNNPFNNQNATPQNMNGPRNTTFICPVCNKRHTTQSSTFERCPHCGVNANDKIYSCSRCFRKFTAEGQGITAPCPYCNENKQNRVASNNANPFMSNGSGGSSNSNDAGSSVRSGSSAYRSGRAIGKICGLIFLFIGFIAGAMKLRG